MINILAAARPCLPLKSLRCIVNGPCSRFCHQVKQEAAISELNDSSEDVLIYKGSLARMVRLVKAFSLTTSGVGLACQPFVISKLMAAKAGFAVGFAATTSVLIVLTPLLLNIITKRYVTELYYEESSRRFTIYYFSFFNIKSKISFTAEDVHIPVREGMFSNFAVGKKRFFVDPNFVLNLKAYEHMMGYDKPLDEIIRIDAKMPTK